MRRDFLKAASILLIMIGMLLACSFFRPGLSPSASATLISATSVQATFAHGTQVAFASGRTAVALAAQTQTVATLAAQPDFRWDIKVFQDGVDVDSHDGEFVLQKRPFILHVETSRPIPVFYNVWDRDDNFSIVNDGSYFDDDCKHGMHPFCTTMMGIATGSDILYIDFEGYAFHVFYIDPRLGEGGSHFIITNSGITYERNVSELVFIGEPQGKGTTRPITEVPIQEFSGDRLYLTFLAKYKQTENLIDNDELRKITLFFH